MYMGDEFITRLLITRQMKLLERERNTKTNMTRTKYVHANAQMNVIVLRSDVRADSECKKISNLLRI